MTALDPIVEHYARLASHPEQPIRDGWSEYLRERVPELDLDFPGIQDRIRDRTRELMREASC